MTDGKALDERMTAFCDRRAILAGLGATAALGATAMLGEGAGAQEAKPKDGKPEETEPAAPAPRRRGISGSESAPASRGPSSSKPFSDGESMPGGLPGSAPTPGSDDPRAPGGLPGAR